MAGIELRVRLERAPSVAGEESDEFWNFERTEKAKAMKLTPVEIITLASIVDEETANNGEKPMIAGMYYNRLMLRNAEYPEGYNTCQHRGRRNSQ
jgi:hypothetical protein